MGEIKITAAARAAAEQQGDVAQSDTADHA